MAKVLVRLAAPVAAGATLSAFYNLADAFWLGRWSKEALAAPGVAMPFLFIVIAFAMGFSTAGTAMVAQHTGARNHHQADRTAAQVLLMIVALTIAMSAPLAIFPTQVFRLVRVPADMLTGALAYFRIIVIGLPFIAFTIGYQSVLRALGDTITVVVIHALANAVNLVLDPVLIFGLGGLPALGARGAALASLLSQMLAAVMCIAALRRGRAGLSIRRRDWRPDLRILRTVIKAGVPAAVANSSNALGYAVLQVMVNALGTNVIAAFTVGFRLMFFFFIPSNALSSAAAPLVGQALGARKPELARRAVWVSVAITAAILLVPCLFFMWQGQLVARAFVADPAVIAETGRFFRLVPASAYCFAVVMVLMSAFYGSGHTIPAMLVSILRTWIIRLPLALLLAFTLAWGSLGVCWAMVAGNVVAALLAFLFFHYGRWQRTIIPTQDQRVTS